MFSIFSAFGQGIVWIRNHAYFFCLHFNSNGKEKVVGLTSKPSKPAEAIQRVTKGHLCYKKAELIVIGAFFVSEPFCAS